VKGRISPRELPADDESALSASGGSRHRGGRIMAGGEELARTYGRFLPPTTVRFTASSTPSSEKWADVLRRRSPPTNPLRSSAASHRTAKQMPAIRNIDLCQRCSNLAEFRSDHAQERASCRCCTASVRSGGNEWFYEHPSPQYFHRPSRNSEQRWKLRAVRWAWPLYEQLFDSNPIARKSETRGCFPNRCYAK